MTIKRKMRYICGCDRAYVAVGKDNKCPECGQGRRSKKFTGMIKRKGV